MRRAARPEQRCANAYLCASTVNGGLEIAAHPHAAHREVMRVSKTGEGGEVRRGVFAQRRDTHQSTDGQAKIAALPQKIRQGSRQYPRLLRFRANIHFDEQLWSALLPRHFLRQHAGKLGPVERRDTVTQTDRPRCLVGL